MPQWKPSGTVEILSDDTDLLSPSVIRTTAKSTSADLIQALGGMQDRIAILLLGGTDDPEPGAKQKLRALFSMGIIPAAAQAGALVIDGMTSGTMELFSGCLAFRRQRPTVIGFVPGLPSALSAGHSVFVLCDGDGSWSMRYRLAEALSASVPVIAVLTGGDETTQMEALACIRTGWHLLAVKDTGGLAEQIANLADPNADLAGEDADLAEIARSPKVRVMAPDSTSDEWQQGIEGRPQPDQTLANIADEYHRWDAAAVAYRRTFTRMQWTAAVLAVAATLCAIVQPEWTGTETARADRAIHYAIIAIPILASGLLAWMSFFRPGSQWLLLRGGAESIKREIFRYRTRSGIYADGKRGAFRATRLAQEVERIRTSLKKSEANKAGEPLPQAAKTGTVENLPPLSGDEYVRERLQDQIRYYEGKTRSLYRDTKWYQAAILLGGGLGAFLAAVGVNKWVALTTAVVTVLTARREAEQQEASIIQYNQALGSLRAIEDWWSSLSGSERESQHNLDLLVSGTETALASEFGGWIQQMQTAVEKAQRPAETTASKPAAEVPASEAASAAAAGGGASDS